MKTNTLKPIFSLVFLLFLVACSTKKDTFLARKSHALSTKYNILYNGQIGLDKGINGIKSNSKDNFWKRLPIERMQMDEEISPEGKPKNADFELAETKATKAIQKHSMNIGGREKNSQIDEAYLLLGKSRYYDQRFVPALDAFNYILYKYPNSSRIYEAKIWREKTNMRLGNDALVVKNMTKMLKDRELKKQVFADANALLSEAFLNLEEKDSALIKLKIAERYTKVNAERARYRFILGQLYEELGKKDSAIYSYQSVIDMNRKSERKYVIQAYAKKAQLFDYKSGDTTAFLKTYNKLIADRENRPFLDVIYREKAVFYDKNNKQKIALNFYNASLKKATTDQYLIASNYRDLGNMYFKNADYPVAAKYYDSTLVKLDVKTREFIRIQKTRKDLDEVIQLEAIAKTNDSILNVVALSETDRVLYFENYIYNLKKTDEAKRILEEKLKAKQENIERNTKTAAIDPASPNQEPGKPAKKSSLAPPTMTSISGQQTSVFYFYNPTTIAFGKLEFKKTWGDRSSNGNWRLSANKTDFAVKDSINGDKATSEDKLAVDKPVEKYTTDYYLKQLPTNQTAIDSIAKERNFAYYQLGVIYKEKFKEYELASAKLEQLLKNNPEEKLILPALYNLYKIYQITDAAKAEAIKNKISSQFPNSRYAQIINNTNSNVASDNESPEKVYNKWYKLYQEEQYAVVLAKIDDLINQFSGDEIVSKFELLKATTLGKLRGLSAYKKALQELADNYPNSEEGKKSVEILTTQIPFLEEKDFSIVDAKNWKILYKVAARADKNTKAIEDKLKLFIANENFQTISYSYDIYTEKENFITIHGINSEPYAKNIIQVLKENKKYKIDEPAIVVSAENYKVIQIKKNLEAYLAPKNP
ncbi:type IX secretion system periplasmic lipoprotein PorW/SprE [Flavobacterium gawalongense]|uniref:Tetratricopeptide repeat protein n=1 Tax=Flavobacterium gawalongense TaxID=2594432 RepID=A0A553BWH0_9FLAO|nr:tetratricopeptide repeat protein [Flavobacterium gawalongense]TRX09731.1 tetratricopeptide repeat protein [Flavobacterium gawalongense]TRX12578.1 tetratricopeptide repeat protein [Flavobacterium gawalongense]TRX26854.1 tetratricopeptide repeat protein [Flavobacterium gawalongense]